MNSVRPEIIQKHLSMCDQRRQWKWKGLESQTAMQLLYIEENANAWASSRMTGRLKAKPSSSITPIWFEYQEIIKRGWDRSTTKATANHLTTWDGSSCFRGGAQKAFRRNKSAVKASVNRPKYLQPQSEHSRWHSSVWVSPPGTETVESHWWVCCWKSTLTSQLHILVWPFKYVSVILCQLPAYLLLNFSPTPITFHLFFNQRWLCISLKIYSIPQQPKSPRHNCNELCNPKPS